MNTVVLVGRLTGNPEVTVTENGKHITKILLAVNRNYKNANGEYDTDFLDCTLWSSIAESTSEYCQSGDMIGVKGRLQNRIIEMPDGNKKRKTEVIAEKITFLSSSQRKADNSERETKITEEKRKADE